jgi:anti-sigma-K factor RskA
MSDDHTISRDDGPPMAAEYVLGVLSVEERRDFERRLVDEPALRIEVEYWEGRLASLASEVKSVDPSPTTWARIEAALKASDGTAIRPGGVWQNLTFWRWAAIGSAAVAAASLVTLAYVGRTPAAGPTLVAKLDVSGGQAGFVAAIDPARSGLTIVPASVTNLNQRVLELWLIAPGDTPRSLGLIEAGRPVHISLPAELIQRIAADATLAVSLEPPGGSPTGLPTGPVIANGKLTKL